MKDKEAIISGTNTDYLKYSGRSKPVLAFQFALSVDSGEIAWAGLDKTTKTRIKAIVEGIATRLGVQPEDPTVISSVIPTEQPIPG